jgi:tRNA (guanosine-2'-O-)-methyltransferase
MMPRSQRRIEKIKRVLALRQPDLTVVMENIHDPHNVSAVLRTCDSVGVLGVELLYTIEKFPRIGKKSSSSANKWLSRRKHKSVDACYTDLREDGFSILATRLDEDSVPVFDLDLTKPTAFVLGNESRGVSDEAAEKADFRIRVPMVGMIESLNVSVAAAVCLYEAYRQRVARSGFASPVLSEEDRLAILEEWLKR